MKIFETNGSIIEQIQKATPAKGDTGNDFKNVMDQMMQDEDKAAPPGMPKGIPEIIPDGIKFVENAGGVHGQADITGKDRIVKELEEALNVIDVYVSKLDDSSIDASGLSPLVDHLEGRLDSLKFIESSGEVPEQLKSIVSELTLTLSTEIAKFRRGDYS